MNLGEGVHIWQKFYQIYTYGDRNTKYLYEYIFM